MAELKTKPTRSSVAAFLKGIKHDQWRKACATVARIMKRLTGGVVLLGLADLGGALGPAFRASRVDPVRA